jgi:hypothetical protein
VIAPIGLVLSTAKRGFVMSTRDSVSWSSASSGNPNGEAGSCIYAYPTKTALGAVKAKVRNAIRTGLNRPLAFLLYRLAPILRGWANYSYSCATSPGVE